MTVITEVVNWAASYPPSGYSEQGTVANIGTSTTVLLPGTTSSLRVDCTGGAAQAYIADTVALRTICKRLYFYIAQSVSGTSSAVQLTNAAISNAYIRLLTTDGTRLTLNATNYAGPIVTENEWHWLDMLSVSTANPAVFDWAIDGVAQTQRTIAGTAADFTAINLGIVTSVTCDLYYGPYKVTDSAGDYPIGAWVPPATSYDPMGMMGHFGMNEVGIHVPQQAHTPSGIYLP